MDDAEREQERYLRAQGARFPALTAEEERDLFRRRDEAAVRDDAAAGRASIEDLVAHNLELVVDAADAKKGGALSFSDLYQEGSLGLIDAVKAYDGKGTFRDFARLHIGLQMDALINSEQEARREETEAVQDARTLDLAQVMFRRDNHRDASSEEMAKVLGWDITRVVRMEQMLDYARAQNDLATLAFIESADELVDLDLEPEVDPYRRLPGAGPDADE
jgi:DNA-directed RNA polymerase sigma subunit (sigma70/sigma32)